MLDIYRRAVSYFGATKQKLKAIEEMAELIVELVKDLLGDGNPAKVIEELADVENMTVQLRSVRRLTAQLRSVRQEKVPPSGSCPIEKRPLPKSSEKLRR